MTHSSHRFTMLSADDVALCRAHSRAVATPPKVRAAVHSMCAAMSDCKQAAPQLPDDLPMPPSYWDDLEHWLKTLAPAKPAAKQPELSADVWHSEPPRVAGVYAMDHVSDKTHNTTMWCAWFDGAGWHGIVSGQDAWAVAQARREPADAAIAVEWTRLIEADAPATKSEIVDASLARFASTYNDDGATLVGEKP